ncbi:MAG: GNAT family N-acetyltransferase [Gammaproteobacteria bacterium]|nr:GNAT family N-acetyltransferase [Gammaproteobacteria bacterium]
MHFAITRTRQIAIRRADFDDAAAIAEVGAVSFGTTYAASSTATDIAVHLEQFFSPAAVRAAMGVPDCGYLIATIDEKPAGMAKWRHGSAPGAVPESNSIALQQLYILPAFQRHGLGYACVDAVAEIGSLRGAHGIWLSVWDHADWAIGFYRKAGFREVGTTDFRVGETLHTDLLMWSPLR